MPNKHEGKILPNFLLGILLVSAGLLAIVYEIKARLPQLDKDFISILTVIVINTGLYFWGSAFVHKMKSDLIRKQRQRLEREKEKVTEL
jgi:hypothetical protein